MCANSGQKGKNDSEKAKKVDTVKCFRGIFKIHLTSRPVIL